MMVFQSDPYSVDRNVSAFHTAQKSVLIESDHTTLPAPLVAYPRQNTDDFRTGLNFYGAKQEIGANTISIRPTKLVLFTLENARFVIGHGLDGMVIDEQNQVMTEPSCFCNHQIYRKSKRLPDLPFYDLDESIFISFDAAVRNYYHWLLYGISKMQIAAKILSGLIKFIVPTSETLATRNPAFSMETYESSLRLSGLHDRVTPLEDGIYRAKRIHFLWHAPTMPELYLNLSLPHQLFDKVDVPYKPELPKRFYVARHGDDRITPEEQSYIDPALESHDYEKVFLEDIDFETQAALFRQAESIVAPHGAGLANLVFARKGTSLLELNRRIDGQPHLRNCFYLLAANRGINYKFFNLSESKITQERFLSALEV